MDGGHKVDEDRGKKADGEESFFGQPGSGLGDAGQFGRALVGGRCHFAGPAATPMGAHPGPVAPQKNSLAELKKVSGWSIRR